MPIPLMIIGLAGILTCEYFLRDWGGLFPATYGICIFGFTFGGMHFVENMTTAAFRRGASGVAIGALLLILPLLGITGFFSMRLFGLLSAS